jgi:hypothetical protein
VNAVTLNNFRSALREATEAQLGFVLIGGLAVAAWAEDFALLEHGIDTFYSKDLDLRGDRPTAQFIGHALRAEGRVIHGFTVVRRKEPPGFGCTYVLSVEFPGIGVVSVEVLEKMPLVDSPDLPPQGFALELAGIRILDPLSLMIGKIHAFNHRAPGLSDKDAVHLQLLARSTRSSPLGACPSPPTNSTRCARRSSKIESARCGGSWCLRRRCARANRP